MIVIKDSYGGRLVVDEIDAMNCRITMYTPDDDFVSSHFEIADLFNITTEILKEMLKIVKS